jgi:Flp pilus assembly CpaE family ATPase
MIDEGKTVNRLQPRRSGRLHPIFVTLAGGDDEQRAALKAVLSQINEFDIQYVGIEGGGKRGERAVILMAILDEANQVGWRRELRARNANQQFASVVALVSNPSPASLRAALRAGADDVLGMPLVPDQAFHTLLRMSELSRREEGLHEKMVCSLVSVSGGVGVSHLAVGLALAIHRLFNKRTVILELDLQAAPLAVLLNVEPEHTISELADPTSTIDSIRLESVLCKHESGLYWLAAPKKIEEAELVSAATVEATLKVLRELFDVVLIDSGSYLTESSIVAWELSDHLLYVLDQTVTAIRSAQRFLDLYQRLGVKDGEPSFVLNRHSAANPITIERIEAALRHPVFAVLPRDDRSFDEQQVTGADFWKIPSATVLRESLESLARKLYGPAGQEGAEPPAGLFSRLLAGIGIFRGAKNGTD